MNKKLEVFISFSLVIIWLATIFYLSSMDTDESNSKSKKTINKVLTISEEIKNTVFDENKIKEESSNDIVASDNNDINQEQDVNNENELNIQNLVEKLNPYLRKCTHAFVYMLLAILLNNALESKNVFGKKKIIITILICFLYAITDEYHQTFVYGRTGRPLDVCIDTVGAVIGCTIYTIYVGIIRFFKNKSKKNKKIADGK